MLFSDLEGFTSISERLGPEELARFLNEYLGIISAEILKRGGTLDKYVGDAVVAFWNAPLNIEDHAVRALSAAMRIQRQLDAAGPRFVARYGVAPHTRIGVATGQAVVGNLGSSLRFAYTAVGDSVNVASRLEAANKSIGTLVLTMSETVAAAFAAFASQSAPDAPIATAAQARHAAIAALDAPDAPASSAVPDSSALPPALDLTLADGESITLKKLGPAFVQGKAFPIELWTIELEISGSEAGKSLPEPWEEARYILK